MNRCPAESIILIDSKVQHLDDAAEKHITQGGSMIDQHHPRRQATTSGTTLDALMGSTRANVLRAIHAGQTTTQVARSLNVSAAAVSRQTTVLREAGLITSHRQLSAVPHTLTPLGRALLDKD